MAIRQNSAIVEKYVYLGRGGFDEIDQTMGSRFGESLSAAN